MEIRFTVPGPPVPKARARVTKQGHAYTPSKTRAYEELVACMAKQAMQGAQPLEGPIWASVVAYLTIPKSWSKKKKALAVSGKLRPTGRPDLDNFVKSILDGAQEICFVGDSQIGGLMAEKWYGEDPRVEVVFSPWLSCEWRSIGTGGWEIPCGPPQERGASGYAYCPYCGRKLKEVSDGNAKADDC